MKDIHIILGAPKREALEPLLQTDGIVIGVDRGALYAIEEGIHVDIALGDFDSITEEEKNIINQQADEMLYDSSEDDTDNEVALLYVLEHYKGSEVYIYNWYGGRVDHLYSILLMVLQERFEELIPKLKLVSEKNVISYYLPGEHRIDRLEVMDYLSFILLTEVDELILNDVKYPLEETSFNRPLALISNEFLNGQASFSFKKGIVAAIQSRD